MWILNFGVKLSSINVSVAPIHFHVCGKKDAQCYAYLIDCKGESFSLTLHSPLYIGFGILLIVTIATLDLVRPSSRLTCVSPSICVLLRG